MCGGASGSHGLRRNRQDIRRAIELLLRDEEWGKWGDREIARRVGCSDKTVGAARRDLESTAEIPQLNERMGADGKARAMPTAPVRQELESTGQIAQLNERIGADGKTRAMPAAPVRAERESTGGFRQLNERIGADDATVPPAATAGLDGLNGMPKTTPSAWHRFCP